MSTLAPIKRSEVQWTDEQLKLITDTVARGATPDELKLFLYRCQNMGLDPLKPGQIHFVKYGTSPGTIVVGIDGFRSRAASTGQISGIQRGVIRDESGKLISAWCEVYRKGWEKPAREEVPFSEYNTGKGPWAKMPETMLKKVAEAATLRMAFPDELGGVYAKEEMDQAESEIGRVAPSQPEPGDGCTDEGTTWKFTFGKWNMKTIEQVYNDPSCGPKALAGYITWLESSADKSGKPLSAKAIETISQIEQFLGAMENVTAE